MIDNPNTNNFYNSDEMYHREQYIPVSKKRLLEKIDELKNNITNETPYHHGNITLDDIVKYSDILETILNNWHY